MNWEKLNMSQRSELMSIYLKNGITSLDEMKKHYNSFAEGGSTDGPPPEEYEKYKYGIPTAEETDNRLYQSSFGTMLPEVKVTAKGDPRKVNNDYYKAHSRARADLQSRVADRTDYEGLNPINLFEYAPVVGDALDATHIANDAFNKNYLSAGIGAGMFLLPNIIEKPLKKLIKRGIRGVTNALDGDLSSPFSQKNTTELLKRMMWDTYLANPTKSSVLSPVSSKAVTEVDFPESSFNYYENSVFPRMLKDPDRVAITSNGSEGRESIMLEDMRGIFEKKPYAGDEEFWDAYNAYRNNEGRAIGLYSPLGDNIFINSHESLGKTNSSLDHELRHRLQQYMPRTDSENKRLKLAYEDTDGIIPDYDMSNEWETMNLDGRQALIGNSNRDIKNQNSLLELTSEDDAYTINKLYNADGYWKRYIDKLTKDFDGPIEEWAKTFEGRRKIHNWIQAMKYVGILSLPLIPSDDNSYAKGGKLDIPPYTQFLNTLPDNLKNSGNEYNMRRYWELNNYPKDFNEGIQLGMFTKQDDGYHANSVAFNPITNSYEFMKDRSHPTYNMELDWYYSDDPEAVEFRKKYKYTPGLGMIPDQYTPIYRDGGPIHIKPENRGKFTALKKRTGHSASWFKENGTPAQRKMAVFELNSKKWRK